VAGDATGRNSISARICRLAMPMKKAAFSCGFFVFGGGKRDRTDDLLHAMQALSQLSYTPKRDADYTGRFSVWLAVFQTFCQGRQGSLSAQCASLIDVYGLLPACKHFTFLTVGSTAHVYPASELGSISRAIMGCSRVWSLSP
jgi:hypothetical protein